MALVWREDFFLTIMNIVINDNDNFGNNIDDHHITGGPGVEGGRRRGGRRHLRGARALCQKSLKSTSTGYEDIHCSLFKIRTRVVKWTINGIERRVFNIIKS